MSKPKKIAHCGDVHLWQNKNFHIHEHVLKNFYKSLEKEKPDLILVTGDVVDSKAKMSPEQMTLGRNFFLNLTAFCPVIVILGNHDLNLQNSDRLDSLSPIIHSVYSEVKYPIHFLKHSGVYDLYNIDWAVWSCLDNQLSPFETEHKLKNDYTFGLYHGVVAGSLGDNGFALSGGIHVDEFKDVQRCAMSDIHSGPQSFRNNEIKYSGSLLQTKISEANEGTYLIWNWDGKNYNGEVKQIKNIYSTVKVHISDLSELDTINLENPEQTLLITYDSDKIKKSDIIQFKKETEIKHKYEIKPAVTKKTSTVSAFTEEQLKQLEKVGLEKVFDTYLELKKVDLGLQEGDNKKLKELDELYSANLSTEKEFETGDYVIEKFVLRNFWSFPDSETVFDFSKDGLYSIIGKNRAGKSSLFAALRFAMFNQGPSSSGSLKKLINKHNRSKDAYVELYLSKNGTRYFIKRTLIPKKKSGVTIELEFLEIDSDGNKIENLKGEKRQDTEKNIQKIFGLESIFDILSLFSAQKKQLEFIDCKNSERLTLVNRFLGLQQFEDKEKELSSDLKGKKAVYQEFVKSFNSEVNLIDLEEKIEEYEKDEKRTELELAELKENIFGYKKDNLSFLDLYNKTKILTQKRVESPDDIAAKIRRVDERISDKEGDAKTQELLLKSSKADLDARKNKFQKLTDSDIKTWKFDNKELKVKEAKVAVNEAEINRCKKQLAIDTCNNCGKDFTEKDKIAVSKKKDSLLTENELLEKEIDIITEERESLEKMQTEYNNLGRKVSNTQNEILQLLLDAKNLADEKGRYSASNEEYLEVEEAKKTFNNVLRPKYEEYELGLDMMQNKLLTLSNENANARNYKKNLQIEINSYKTKFAKLQEYEEGIRINTIYKSIIHNDGLPLFILNAKIDMINRQVNEIVNQVFDFDVQFSIDEEAGDLNIDFAYEGDEEKSEVSFASGAETFIINLCIKVGLSQISELPKLNSLLIDEGFGALDKDTLDKIPALFIALNEYYKNIIFISHLDELKDISENIIKLEKKGKYTQVL